MTVTLDDVEQVLAATNGILRLEPAWSQRDFYRPGVV